MDQAKTSIMGEFTLYFDNEYDVYQITEILGIHPTSCKRRSETRKNPLSGEKNEGYWTFATEYVETLDLQDVVNEMIKNIIPRIALIKDILKINEGKTSFCFVPKIENEEIPAMYFERGFLTVVEELEATIELDLYVN